MKRVLFLCVANACRSQMAEGFARALGADVVEAYSAGSNPSRAMHPDTVTAMQEVGIDLRGARPKGLQQLPVQRFDIAVSLCEDSCPAAMAAEHRHWAIPNPDGLTPEQFRRVRDDIRRRTEQLIGELRSPNAERPTPNAPSKAR